jgi:photosystem II stability/assembly factor-like uncharacterized protein
MYGKDDKMNRKMIFPTLVLLLAILACNLPAATTKSPITVTDTIAPVKALSTATSPSLPVVASPQISDLQMLDVNNGWAIGTGKIMRTPDGGSTWYDVTPTGISGLDVTAGRFFLDPSKGWVTIAGADLNSGTLYRSIDGGITWNSTTIPFSGASLYFTDASDGWALVGLGSGMSHEAVAIFRTSDGGITWNQVFINDPTVPGSSDSLPFVGDKNGIVALDGNHAWVTGAQPSSDFIYIYVSQDGGSSWSQPAIDMPAGYAGAMTNAFLPHFFGSTNGILPVGMYSNAPGTVFYLSKDGGLTWTPTTPVVLNGNYSIASAVDFFVWDGGPALSISHDAGSTWSTEAPNINLKDTLMSFQFVNATTGWAVTGDASNHNSLYKTTDGGTTWLTIIP